MIVVDANVIMALFISSPKTPIAEALYKIDKEWRAPVLWVSEFRNGSLQYIRKGLSATPDVLMALAKARQTLTPERTYQPNDRDVMALSSRYPCTAYDCEYVAVAESLNIPLVTWDRDILKYFQDRAVTPEFYVEYHRRKH